MTAFRSIREFPLLVERGHVNHTHMVGSPGFRAPVIEGVSSMKLRYKVLNSVLILLALGIASLAVVLSYNSD